MILDTLHIFSKNTDAHSSQRGYNYQTLKTLYSWIQNFLEGNKVEIYCEYEEDIFHKDSIEKTAAFRQIKLYSENFSFSSEEIRKSIAHFFILHTKTDYKNFSKSFYFETNTSIANKRLNNDADLLKEWNESQDNLNNEQLIKFATKVKEIVTEYINNEKERLKSNAQLDDALLIFEKLDLSFWKDFTASIKWRFIGSSPAEELSTIQKNIQDLISQLPEKLIKNKESQIFGILLKEVFSTVNNEEHEKRKLIYSQFERILLEISDNDDKWYSRRYSYYKDLSEISEFRIGEFEEILNLANYCRRKKYLHGHKDTWNPFLIYYSRNQELDDVYKRKAIYELIILNREFHEVDYDNLAKRIRPNGSLHGYEEDIRYFFRDIRALNNIEALEKSNNLISFLFVAIEENKVDISLEDLKTWFLHTYRRISQKLLSEKDPNEICSLLELKGEMLFGINKIRNRNPLEFIYLFDKVLEQARTAFRFKLSRFNERIEKYIKIQLNSAPADRLGVIKALEDFSNRLLPLIELREGKIRRAESEMQRGMNYIKTNLAENWLRALGYFQKAKFNYQQEDTIENYIQALIKISQVYDKLGMLFAAKHHGLAAYRIGSNRSNLKWIEVSLVLVAHNDYRLGAWLQALTKYRDFFILRLEGNYDPDDYDLERLPTKNIAFISYLMRRTSSQFNDLLSSYIASLDYIGEEIILPIEKKISDEILSDEIFRKALEKEIIDFPLNDIGPERNVNFYALGCLWSFKFKNEFPLISSAEEFIAAIQIVLVEIASSDFDFHLLKSEVDITLILTDELQHVQQVPCDKGIKFNVYIRQCEKLVEIDIHNHSTNNLNSIYKILNILSVLKQAEIPTQFKNFSIQYDILPKIIVVDLYQKLHRDIYFQEDFDLLQPAIFQKEKFDFNFPSPNKIIIWRNDLSTKYDNNFSLKAIKNRYTNAEKCIYITLAKIKKDPDFDSWLQELRNVGWKDWYIITTMVNFIIDKKIDHFDRYTGSNDQEYKLHYQKMFKKYSAMDEKDCYLEFSIENFKSEHFIFSLQIGIAAILKTYGLEAKQITPDFRAIKDFLDIRMNMHKDDLPEDSLLNLI
ncbi:hypothetical protein CMU32_12215 [Elizabethkingia anophelis]|nr:hypothetical protein [Elizabethkingia anophelis]